MFALSPLEGEVAWLTEFCFIVWQDRAIELDSSLTRRLSAPLYYQSHNSTQDLCALDWSNESSLGSLEEYSLCETLDDAPTQVQEGDVVIWDGQILVPTQRQQQIPARRGDGDTDENDPAGTISPNRRQRIRAAAGVSSTTIVRSMR